MSPWPLVPWYWGKGSDSPEATLSQDSELVKLPSGSDGTAGAFLGRPLGRVVTLDPDLPLVGPIPRSGLAWSQRRIVLLITTRFRLSRVLSLLCSLSFVPDWGPQSRLSLATSTRVLRQGVRRFWGNWRGQVLFHLSPFPPWDSTFYFQLYWCLSCRLDSLSILLEPLLIQA